jgi:DNA-binding winged helix-turn-helix (wHTH) protein
MSSFAEPLRRRADAGGAHAAGSLTAARIRIGGLEIDMRRREIHRDGRSTRLQDQPFHLLALLLERPGAVVTRPEIERRLWPDGTSVDFEHAVNAAIRRLRVALGDDAVTPHFVETVPRRGYRFVAPVDAAARVDERATGPVVGGPRPRIVVRRFATVGTPAEDALSLGLGEELVAQLADRGGDRVAVITRPSADEGAPVETDYRVDGSVRVAGDRVRVIARLIGRDDTLRWASGYDRNLDDALTVQAEVAAAIADAVVGRLLPAPAPIAATPAPTPAWSASRREWARGITTSNTRWTSTLAR